MVMKTSVPVAYGVVLKRLREEKHMSQALLAEWSGYDRTFISLLERGVRQPSLTTIVVLAETMRVPLKEVMSQFENELRRERD